MSHEDFNQRRERGQALLMEANHLGLKRFLRLDAACYEPGALDAKTKELLGLVASSVLRCNDCIEYHLGQCVTLGCTKDELVDAMNVALIVGGSIVIPHFRHAMIVLEDLLPDDKP